jgi:serine/threonine protein kinase
LWRMTNSSLSWSFARVHPSIKIVGDLGQHIKKRRETGKHFSENLILNWLLQLVMALEYIHGKKILHRDIKAANVFLTAGCVIKLGDFGISKILSETVHSKTFVGTPYYMSPEMCMNQSYTNKSDIWSLGCVLFEVAALEYPFKGKNLMALLQNITSSDP